MLSYYVYDKANVKILNYTVLNILAFNNALPNRL